MSAGPASAAAEVLVSEEDASVELEAATLAADRLKADLIIRSFFAEEAQAAQQLNVRRQQAQRRLKQRREKKRLMFAKKKRQVMAFFATSLERNEEGCAAARVMLIPFLSTHVVLFIAACLPPVRAQRAHLDEFMQAREEHARAVERMRPVATAHLALSLPPAPPPRHRREHDGGDD